MSKKMKNFNSESAHFTLAYAHRVFLNNLIETHGCKYPKKVNLSAQKSLYPTVSEQLMIQIGALPQKEIQVSNSFLHIGYNSLAKCTPSQAQDVQENYGSP